MCNLFERFYDPTYRWIRDVLAGLVFLGTPHPTIRRRENWSPLSLILRAVLRMPGNMLSQAELEAVTIANVSDKFHNAVSGTGLPVLSVFEKKKTHIGDKLSMNRKHLVSERHTILIIN